MKGSLLNLLSLASLMLFSSCFFLNKDVKLSPNQASVEENIKRLTYVEAFTLAYPNEFFFAYPRNFFYDGSFLVTHHQTWSDRTKIIFNYWYTFDLSSAGVDEVTLPNLKTLLSLTADSRGTYFALWKDDFDTINWSTWESYSPDTTLQSQSVTWPWFACDQDSTIEIIWSENSIYGLCVETYRRFRILKISLAGELQENVPIELIEDLKFNDFGYFAKNGFFKIDSNLHFITKRTGSSGNFLVSIDETNWEVNVTGLEHELNVIDEIQSIARIDGEVFMNTGVNYQADCYGSTCSKIIKAQINY